MSNYRRAKMPGGFYFFTVVTYKRCKILCNSDVFSRLKESFRLTAEKFPFRIKSIVVLPDHLHCIWQLPEGDTNYSVRWNLIKRILSVGMPSTINDRREKQIWQRRFWEHCIRDKQDYLNHLDYIHYNPVKHQLVNNPIDWPYSSFRQYQQKGFYEEGWGCFQEPDQIKNFEFE